jgi:hypothetical protein
VEGFNNKANVTTKRAYGFRTYDMLKIALYHTLGVTVHRAVNSKKESGPRIIPLSGERDVSAWEEKWQRREGALA